MKYLILGAIALGFSATAAQAQVAQVGYGTLTGTQTVTFDDLAGGPNYDNIFFSNGVGFAERFVGQTLTTAGGADVLGGTPTDPLALQTGLAGQNLSTFINGGTTNVLTGNGPLGYPSFGAIGEGAFAALFSSDQSQFGFQLIGGDGGTATINFFRANGSLIQQVIVTNLADAFYGFQRDGNVNDIRGISIYNNDGNGIGFDNLRFDVQSMGGAVPEPATWAMMLVGFGAMGVSMRRRRPLVLSQSA